MNPQSNPAKESFNMKKNPHLLILSICFLYACTAKEKFPLSDLSLDQHPLITHCEKQVGEAKTQLESFKQFVYTTWKNNAPSLDTGSCRFSHDIPTISILLRADGVEVAQRWSPILKKPEDLADFIIKTKQSLTQARQQEITSIEIYISHSYERLHYNKNNERNTLRANIHTGMQGIEIQYGDIIKRYHPGYPITRKLKNRTLIDQFIHEHKISKDHLEQNKPEQAIRFSMFKGSHLLIFLNEKPRIYHLHRSNEIIALNEVNKANTQKWLNLAKEWLLNNVHEDGRMTYRYLPSDRREASDNNMIRQWMASVALGKAALTESKPEIWALSEKNIDYNLKNFYHREGDFGVIEYDGMVKLGALALAALAIIEHPQRIKWRDQEQSLLRSIDSLWHDDGSFSPIFKPANQYSDWGLNFYPGETLLMWSVLYQQNKDPKLLDKFMRSFRYYRTWHLDERNRKPSFIPWHTQAYFNIWQITKNKELETFIFEMNDWLIEQMLASTNIYPDTLGRFYNPNKIPHIPNGNYGVPHASSTGVYLEGVIDAYRLAIAIDDKKRAENYRIAILKGMRSMMQLQYQDEADMYYIQSNKQIYVKGGLKENVYKNEIRCDNIQHPFMGILKIINTFNENNYSSN